MKIPTQKVGVRGFISTESARIRVKPNTSSQTIDNYQFPYMSIIHFGLLRVFDIMRVKI